MINVTATVKRIGFSTSSCMFFIMRICVKLTPAYTSSAPIFAIHINCGNTKDSRKKNRIPATPYMISFLYFFFMSSPIVGYHVLFNFTIISFYFHMKSHCLIYVKRTRQESRSSH